MVDWLAHFRGWMAARRSTLGFASIFMMLWCGALIAHYDTRLAWERSTLATLTTLLAFVGMFFTRSKLLMLAVLCLMLGGLIEKMPKTDNHWFFAGVISLGLILGIVVQTIKDRGLAPLRDDWLERTAPALRMLVILLYFFAVFHKLNWDYFNPDVSCAVHFYERALRTPLMPSLEGEISPGVRHLLIWGVLGLEFSIPLFLLIPRTWFIGVMLGVLFHMLTAAFMRHFPSIMFATYFLFVPKNDALGADVRQELTGALESILRRLSSGRVGLVGFLALESAFWTTWSLRVWWAKLQLGVRRTAEETGYYYLLRSWNVFILCGVAVVLVLAWRQRWWRHAEGRAFATAWWPLYLLPLAFALNNLSPHLGLKTATSQVGS